MTQPFHPAKGRGPLDSSKAVHSALRFSRPQSRKQAEKGQSEGTMKAKTGQAGAGVSQSRQWLTLRVSTEEKERVEEQAGLAGLSVSEYMRRTIFGGRPVVAAADEAMLRELRRIGGLLKHNFQAVQQAESGQEITVQMGETLRLLSRSIETIASSFREHSNDR